MEPKKRFWKLALVMAAVLGVSVAGFYYGLFSPDFWQEVRQERLGRQILNELEAQRRREAEDPYGGQTPQETYQLLVSALEEGDIELASKYFAFDKQSWAQNFFAEVKEKGVWDEMIADLRGETARIEYGTVEEPWYEIHVRRSGKGFIALIQLQKYTDRDLWKIINF